MKHVLSSEELGKVRSAIDEQLIGSHAWGVKLGIGSFVTMEFGEPLPPTPKGVVHGQWHMWIYGARWTGKGSACTSVTSDTDRAVLAEWLKLLEGKRLVRFEFDVASSASALVFEPDVRIEMTSDTADDGGEPMLSWMLFLPNGDVLEAGPGDAWRLETKANEAGS